MGVEMNMMGGLRGSDRICKSLLVFVRCIV